METHGERVIHVLRGVQNTQPPEPCGYCLWSEQALAETCPQKPHNWTSALVMCACAHTHCCQEHRCACVCTHAPCACTHAPCAVSHTYSTWLHMMAQPWQGCVLQREVGGLGVVCGASARVGLSSFHHHLRLALKALALWSSLYLA